MISHLYGIDNVFSGSSVWRIPSHTTRTHMVLHLCVLENEHQNNKTAGIVCHTHHTRKASPHCEEQIVDFVHLQFET
jgi:hypothetical protein